MPTLTMGEPTYSSLHRMQPMDDRTTAKRSELVCVAALASCPGEGDAHGHTAGPQLGVWTGIGAG